MTGREQRKASCSRQTWHPERCHNQACNGVTLPLPGIVQLRQWLCHKVENWGTVVPFPRRTRNLSHFQIYLISKFISFPNLSHFKIYPISKFISFPNLSHFQIYLISKFISFPNHPDWSWGWPSHLLNEYRGLFPWGWRSQSMKLTSHLHWVLSFRKRLLGISTYTWEDNVMGGMEWTDLTHHRNSWQALVNAIMKLWVP